MPECTASLPGVHRGISPRIATRRSWRLIAWRAGKCSTSRLPTQPASGCAIARRTCCARCSCPEALSYDPQPKGLLTAREAVAGYYAERGSSVSPDDLILTTSTSEAYSFVFRLLCDPGDAVLVPTPSYPLFDFLAEIQDVKLFPYELIYDHGWQMDFPSLQAGNRKGEHVRKQMPCRAGCPSQ